MKVGGAKQDGKGFSSGDTEVEDENIELEDDASYISPAGRRS